MTMMRQRRALSVPLLLLLLLLLMDATGDSASTASSSSTADTDTPSPLLTNNSTTSASTNVTSTTSHQTDFSRDVTADSGNHVTSLPVNGLDINTTSTSTTAEWTSGWTSVPVISNMSTLTMSSPQHSTTTTPNSTTAQILVTTATAGTNVSVADSTDITTTLGPTTLLGTGSDVSEHVTSSVSVDEMTSAKATTERHDVTTTTVSSTQTTFADEQTSNAHSTRSTNDHKEDGDSSMVAVIVVLAILIMISVGVGGFLCIRWKQPSAVALRSHRNETHIDMKKFPSVRSKPVKSMEFIDYVGTLERDSGLLYYVEYEELKHVGREQTWDQAELQCNRPKNRFTDILPYDVTRVKLLPLEDVDGSDYINANWIPGYSSKREYIATQGPLPSTRDDFWRMIWEYNCRAVVMLTLCTENGRIKCDHYWPTDSEPLFYGDLQIKILNENLTADWHVRELQLSLGEQTRRVKHFHYVKWPDMKVPDKLSMLSFVQIVRNYAEDKKGHPIVVHCSAGVGRTGTFIALDVLSQQLIYDDIIDVFAVVYHMRTSRVRMVQTEQQYIFVHECVRHMLAEKARIDRDNGETVYMNCMELQDNEDDDEAESQDELSSEISEVEDSLSDEGIEEETCEV